MKSLINENGAGRFASAVFRVSAMVLFSTSVCFGGTYSGGDGLSEATAYVIADVNDLLELAETKGDYGAYFKLTNDIDLAGRSFTTAVVFAPDVHSAIGGAEFTGVFDGGGHAIRHLTISASEIEYVGLFGHIGEVGQIRNLGVVDADIQGRYYVGGLTGSNSGSIICCYASGTVSGTDDIGGLAGRNYEGSISSCYATGSVSGTGYHAGGLVGVTANGLVENCYATGAVSGYFCVGGLTGKIDSGTIDCCYAAGAVSGTDYVGGLVGYNDGTVTSSFWDVETSGQYDCWGGGTGKTTAQMKMQSTFTGWDFAETWAICEGTNYARLQWQIPAADWVCPDGVGVEDLAYLAARWLTSDCGASGDCDGADLDGSGTVEMADYMVFASEWMKGV